MNAVKTKLNALSEMQPKNLRINHFAPKKGSISAKPSPSSDPERGPRRINGLHHSRFDELQWNERLAQPIPPGVGQCPGPRSQWPSSTPWSLLPTPYSLHFSLLLLPTPYSLIPVFLPTPHSLPWPQAPVPLVPK